MGSPGLKMFKPSRAIPRVGKSKIRYVIQKVRNVKDKLSHPVVCKRSGQVVASLQMEMLKRSRVIPKVSKHKQGAPSQGLETLKTSCSIIRVRKIQYKLCLPEGRNRSRQTVIS